MALAVAIVNLIASLFPIAAKLFTGSISEAEARKQSSEALSKFADELRGDEKEDVERDKEIDDRLAAVDAAKAATRAAAGPATLDRPAPTGLIGDDGSEV